MLSDSIFNSEIKIFIYLYKDVVIEVLVIARPFSSSLRILLKNNQEQRYKEIIVDHNS
jgi:hypothetical protein